MKITSLGAAGEVTGSQHLIETDRLRILLDCGLTQGPPEFAAVRNRNLRCRPEQLDAVFLSHAHIDHCGLLPALVRAGYDGPIFASEPTLDLTNLMLRDSARLQSAGADGPVPLYGIEDVKRTMRLTEPIDNGDFEEIFDDLRVRTHRAGHILGARITELEIRDGRSWRTVIFTGDLGPRGGPLLPDPFTEFDRTDVILCESTYGNLTHRPRAEVLRELVAIFRQIAETDGCLIIPAFSLGRTQQLLVILKQLSADGELPPLPIVIDSPLAGRVTAVYRDYLGEFHDRARRVLGAGTEPFGFAAVTTVESSQQSKELNDHIGPLVIIAASGMCEGGRVVHHLRRRLDDPSTTVLFMGFQAEGTTGRAIADGAREVRLGEKTIPVRAEIRTLSGLSAHADAEDLKWWFGELSATAGGPDHTFLVHGESDASRALAELIRDDCNTDPVLSRIGQTYDV